MRTNLKIRINVIGSFLLLLFIDQLLKYTIQPKIINQSIVFGLGDNMHSIIGIMINSIALLFLLIILFKKSLVKYEYVLYGLLLMGLSNYVDRLVYGGVIDYIRVANIWFNIADLVINLILIYLIINILKHNGKRVNS